MEKSLINFSGKIELSIEEEEERKDRR